MILSESISIFRTTEEKLLSPQEETEKSLFKKLENILEKMKDIKF